MKESTTLRRCCSVVMVIFATFYSLQSSANSEGDDVKTALGEGSAAIEVQVAPEESLTESPVVFYNPKKLKKNSLGINVHTNLLHWAIATPNIGVSYTYRNLIELVVDADFAPWQWRDETRGYKVWNVQPQLRYYLKDRFYVGGEMHMGELRWKLTTNGHQGDYIGGGAVVGYKLPITKKSNIELDFNLGLGCTQYNYDTYLDAEGYLAPIDTDLTKNCWGLTAAGVTLIYKW